MGYPERISTLPCHEVGKITTLSRVNKELEVRCPETIRNCYRLLEAKFNCCNALNNLIDPNIV